MRIALDAMGTDEHPRVEVEGAAQALRELPGDFRLSLVGNQQLIEAELAKVPDLPRDRLDIVHASQIVAMNDPPATALRRKPDSSIVVGLKLHKADEVDAFISAGSTGAVMAASLFLLGPLPGVDRPGVAAVIPTATTPTLLIDAGANIDCKPHHLLQFARLGAVYSEDVFGCTKPRIGLLNIGEEEEKGNEVAVETYQRLRDSDLNFIGNVLLKFYESVAAFMSKRVGSELGAAATGIDLDRVFHMFDWTQYGGAPLLGVNGISIICHGGSPPVAIRNAVRVAIQAVERQMVGHIKREIADHDAADHAEGPVLATAREKTASSAGGYTENS